MKFFFTLFNSIRNWVKKWLNCFSNFRSKLWIHWFCRFQKLKFPTNRVTFFRELYPPISAWYSAIWRSYAKEILTKKCFWIIEKMYCILIKFRTKMLDKQLRFGVVSGLSLHSTRVPRVSVKVGRRLMSLVVFLVSSCIGEFSSSIFAGCWRDIGIFMRDIWASVCQSWSLCYGHHWKYEKYRSIVPNQSGLSWSASYVGEV